MKQTLTNVNKTLVKTVELVMILTVTTFASVCQASQVNTVNMTHVKLRLASTVAGLKALVSVSAVFME